VNEQLDEGASSRGAAGCDIRFSEVSEELIDACKERLESLLVERSNATPLYRKMQKSLTKEGLLLSVVSTNLSRVLGLLDQEDIDIEFLALAVESDPALEAKVVDVAIRCRTFAGRIRREGFVGGRVDIRLVR